MLKLFSLSTSPLYITYIRYIIYFSTLIIMGSRVRHTILVYEFLNLAIQCFSFVTIIFKRVYCNNQFLQLLLVKWAKCVKYMRC